MRNDGEGRDSVSSVLGKQGLNLLCSWRKQMVYENLGRGNILVPLISGHVCLVSTRNIIIHSAAWWLLLTGVNIRESYPWRTFAARLLPLHQITDCAHNNKQ